MRMFIIMLWCYTASIQGQNAITLKFISKTACNKVDTLFYRSQDSTMYYKENENFIVENHSKKLSYSNLQLGKLSLADSFNPLKINLFYREFNTVIVLDNRLAEMYRINFNLLDNYKHISHVSTGSANTIWIYNQNNQQLELFDYKALKSTYKTPPILSPIIAIKSNYNYCWILTKTDIYCFSYFGTLLCKLKAESFDSITLLEDNCIIKKENTLFYVSKDTKTLTPLHYNKDISIKAFFTTNQTLYIYDDNYIYNFNIK